MYSQFTATKIIFNVKNKYTGKMHGICSKLLIKSPE